MSMFENYKQSIPTPKTIGVASLTDTFGKIRLSPEVKDFLSALSARLVVSYSGGSNAPEFEILDRTGGVVCSIDEFVKLGGFRRWVNDELKALEKEQSSKEKIELLALFFRKAREKNFVLGERIDEANETRFRQFHAMISIIGGHLEVIENTIRSPERTYLLEKGTMLVNVIYKLMLDSLKTERVRHEDLDKEVFEVGIPKWILNRMIEKSFTSNLGSDSKKLLFPKGNYLKSIALSTKEMNDESFLTMNQDILGTSGGMIALAKKDWRFLFPDIGTNINEVVMKYYDSIPWVLNNPYTSEEILDVRAGGKAPPIFKARQKPNPKSGKGRPENEAQRVCREIYNTMGIIQCKFLEFQNFVIPVADPLRSFWSRILANTDEWEITPSHNLFDLIKESGQDVSQIRNLSNLVILRLMGEVTCQSLRIMTGSIAGENIVSTYVAMLNRPSFVRMADPHPIDSTKYDVDVAVMKTVTVSNDVLDDTKRFLGVRVSKKKDTKKTRQASVRLGTETLRELRILEDSEMLPKVKEWLSSTFKTGRKNMTQFIAAQRVVGEVLKYQDKIIGEDFDEYRYLDEIEDSEDDD